MNHSIHNSLFLPLLSLILLPLFTSQVIAQDLVEFRLVDQNERVPIAGAFWNYDEQKGTSDPDGTIRFRLEADAIMSISHVSYGQWDLTSRELQKALEDKILMVEIQPQALYPVTIMALRPKADERKRRDLNYEEKMAHDAGALLTDIPGISSIRKSGAYGFDPVVRGFKYDQLNVVMDGVQSALAACPNRMDPPTSQMAPNMIERIEVLKGPHQLRYGNAFGATINFAGVDPDFTPEKNTYGRISSGYESNGNILRSEGMAGFSGETYDLGVFGSWSQGQDIKSGNKTMVPADFLRLSFGSNLGWKLSADQTLKISGVRNVARDVDFPSLMMDLRDDDTWLLKAQHEIKFQHPHLRALNSALYGSLVDHRMDNGLKILEPRMMNAATNAKTRVIGGRTEANWKYAAATLYAGVDIRSDQAEGVRIREFLLGPNAGKSVSDNAWQNSRITKSAIFTEYQWRRSDFQWVVSGRLEYNQGRILDLQPEFNEVSQETEVDQVNPSLSLGGIKNFDSGIATGLWIGRAQRSGSLIERYINYLTVGLDPYELVGNPALKPEVNNQVDFTFQYRNHHFTVNADLFASYLQDFITSTIDPDLTPRLPNSPGVRKFSNLDEAMLTGVEIEFNHTISTHWSQRFSLAYTYGQDISRSQPLPEIAPLDLRYQLRGSWWHDRLQPEISLRQVATQNRTSVEYGETETPAFFLADLGIKYQVLENMKIAAGILNIFDENYYEHLTRSTAANRSIPVYAPGRSFSISISLDFR
ncbi:MAG: TonB-dependent receptor [Saprospiraceae bacterium]|nr:TonB-dependent receptor [Saprospiraceae bacterium]